MMLRAKKVWVEAFDDHVAYSSHGQGATLCFSFCVGALRPPESDDDSISHCMYSL